MRISHVLDHGIGLLTFARTSALQVVQKTFVCCDVVSFASMTERLGDRGSLEVMRRVARIVRNTTRDHTGTELELMGDCFLLAFASTEKALRCAVAIQRAIDSDRIAHPGEGVELRIALHAGSVVRNGDGYFGRNLILAFRLLERAASGEIVISSDVMGRVEPHWSRHFTAERVFLPKGFGTEVRFVSVTWSGSGLLGPRLRVTEPVLAAAFASLHPCDA
jgi:class 3 adenylate cyclase